MLRKNLLADTKWAERGGRPALQIGLTTFPWTTGLISYRTALAQSLRDTAAELDRWTAVLRRQPWPLSAA